MDLRGKTFWEMEKEAISFAHKNENFWIRQSALAAVVNQLDQNEHELDLAFKAQGGNNPEGEVARKNQLLDAFFTEIYRLGRKLSFFAKVSGDKTLLIDSDLAESTLPRLPEKEAFIRCSNLIKIANKYLAQCIDFGLTEEGLKKLSEDLALLEQLQPSIGMITNDRKSAGRSILTLTAEARSILDKLDDGFEGLVDDETFLNGWFAVRKIKGRHRYDKAPAPSEGN